MALVETFGRYELIARLGRGGMAEVFLARLGSGDGAKQLAIKRLLPGCGDNPRLVQRLIDEARLCVWLSHPNIVQVFDFGRCGDSYFIAMEYVDGCDLHALLNPPGKPSLQLPMEVALELCFRVVDALRHAHNCTDGEGRQLGIIHRDVSPQNILISRDGYPKLADFGVARAALEMRDQTRPGIVLGKYSYMAPEQAAGGSYDRRVDLYASGATLYQMLTGSTPFVERADRPAASPWWELPRAPSSLRSSIPPSLDALIMKAMAPRADARYSTADEMAVAVLHELAVAGGPPKPHQLRTLVAQTMRQRRGRKWLSNHTPATPRDFPLSEESLIPSEVTQVHHLHSVFDDLPVVEMIEEAEPPPPEPLVVVSPAGLAQPSSDPALARTSTDPAIITEELSLPEEVPGEPTLRVTRPRDDVTEPMPASPLPSPGVDLDPGSSRPAGVAPRGPDPPGAADAQPSVTDGPDGEHRLLARLTSAVDRLGRLDRASWVILGIAGLLMLLVGLCLGSQAR
jgi:serine/threonine-protein kinase